MNVEINHNRVLTTALWFLGVTDCSVTTEGVCFSMGLEDYKADKKDPELLVFLANRLAGLIQDKADRSRTLRAYKTELKANVATEAVNSQTHTLSEKHALDKVGLLLGQAEELVKEGMEITDKHYEFLAEVLTAYASIPDVELVK